MSDSDTDDSEFDAAFEEAIASRGDAPAHDAAADDERDPIDDDGDGQSPGSAHSEAGSNDQAAAPAPAQPSDIWANAPQELREARERETAQLMHRLNSTAGRLSASDRELARLRAERVAKAGTSDGNASTHKGLKHFEAEEVQRSREEYGEAVTPGMNATINTLTEFEERIAPLEAMLAASAEERAAAAQQAQIDVFTAAHPDYWNYVDRPEWNDWVDSQPPLVQQMIQRARTVEDGQEAAWLLTQFKSHLGAIAPSQNRQDTAQPHRDPRRQRQLAAGRDGGQGSPPVQSGSPEDWDGAVDAAINRSDRQQRNGRF